MTPCSLLNCNRGFGGTYCLHLQGLLATCLLADSCWIISSTLNMKAICSSETSVATQQTTWSHIPEGDTLHNHRCVNLKTKITLSSYLHNWALCHEDIWRSGGITPSLSTSALNGSECSASRPCRFTPGGNNPRYPSYGRLGGPHSRSWCYGEGKNLLLLRGIEPRPLCRPTRSYTD
jgi:hypothetical protein